MSGSKISPIPSLEKTSSVNLSSQSTLGTNDGSGTSKNESSNSMNTVDLQRLSISVGDHPVEQADWLVVNERLRDRGFTPITVSHRQNYQIDAGFTVLDEKTSDILRKTILHLLQENDRRHVLFQEIVASTKQLKEDNEELEEKMESFQVAHKESKEKERHFLEDKYEQRLKALQEEINDLRTSLDGVKNNKSNIQDVSQNQNNIKKPIVDHHNPEKAVCSNKYSRKTMEEREPPESDINYSHLSTIALKSLEKQLHKMKKKCSKLAIQIGEYARENNELKLQMHHMKSSTTGELKKSNEEKKIFKDHKRLLQILQDNNLMYLCNQHKGNTPRKANHMNELSITECQQLLQDICKVLHILDYKEIVPKIRSVESKKQFYAEIEKLLERIYELAVGGHSPSINILETRMELLSAVDSLKSDQEEIKDIYSLIKDISVLIIPWKNSFENDTNGDEISLSTLKHLLKNIKNNFYKGPAIEMSNDNELLHNFVAHFMKLFDVRSYNGLYTRMNDVYVKYHEFVNVFHTIRRMLHMNDVVGMASIVDAIGQLSKARHLLHVKHLDSVIKDVEQYDEFYDAFYTIVKELTQLLGVDNLDEITPAVRSLLRFPSK